MTDTTTADLIPTPNGPALDLTGTGGAWPRKARLEIRPDSDPEDPTSYGPWRIVSFNHRHRSYVRDLREIGFTEERGGRPGIGLASKLRAGTAFFLSAYEHGGISWSLKGEHPMAGDMWDFASYAGIILLKDEEDPADYPKEKREEYARNVVEEYTDWCNGEVYGYILTDPDTGQDIDSCWGYIGLQHCRDAAKEALGDRILVDEDDETITVEDVDPTYK